MGSAIKDRSITEIKLSDYSTCLRAGGQPSGDYKLGQFWFHAQHISAAGIWPRFRRRPVAERRLWRAAKRHLRWAGTVNADTSTITTLTDIGISEGLTAGGFPIPHTD